jgi:very long chain acyl-CoA dehydrogenase
LSNSPIVRVTTLRCLATTAPEPKGRRDKSISKKAVHSKSFVQNIFRGIIEPAQAYPYPNVLNEEQRDTLQMLVDPTEKFMTEKNDALKNDALESVPEDTVQVRSLNLFCSRRRNNTLTLNPDINTQGYQFFISFLS